ncbi:AAA family ATPase [Pseudoalteromonas ruthenica]|uniref:AAA family ATPase n=1 Tax=Pseudoalteromonas ruthenica TaxID=151081 RepID=UPI00241E600F|nr:AAA family ATPase [Pseudoalteromonas ruthenica]|tara:strand:+ start:44544 stop:46790 length:2247 start_codon:yes stop_codon:yes gene_type:complete
MIESFKLKGVATYKPDGIEVNGLKKVNFFYGANGCGKTTASNYLTDTSIEKFNECSIQWQGNTPLNTLVYNKAFRDKNFGGSDIAGVFTLGEASTEQVEQIRLKKAEFENEDKQLKGNQTVLKQKNVELDTAVIEFTEQCWSLYKKYGDDFKEALQGSLKKKLFKDKILQFSDSASDEEQVLKHELLIEKAKTLLGERPEVYQELPSINFDLLSRIEQDDIWQRIIVGKSDVNIAAMIDALGSHDWVNQGRKYLGEGETCPFCQRATIDEAFKAQLEGYFDDDFSVQTEKVAELRQSYAQIADELINSLQQLLDSERNNPNSKLDLEAFIPYFHALESAIKSNVLGFSEKVEKASLQFEVCPTTDASTGLQDLINKANDEIRSHNQLATDFDKEIAKFKAQVWQFLADEINDDYKRYKKKATGLEKAVGQLNKTVNERTAKVTILKTELEELSKNNTSVQPAVDEINRLLKAYGFLNFEILPSKQLANHYVIQRQDGTLALDTLSEGEVTFITFLYFVQLANGALTQDAVTENRVVVIDDPISSLDSNVLYIVSAIVKQMIKEVKDGSPIKQLLLFTHNVYFHKEASFQGGRANGCNQTHFWILRKANNITSIQPYEQRNPIESSYELLWREIKEQGSNSCITIQNTMRRILENYFKILGKFSDGDIEAKFKNPQEQQVCRSLLYWINDGSHCLPDDLFIQNQNDTVDIYRDVFRDVFKYSGHIAHYNMMMGIKAEAIKSPEEQEVAA